MTTLEAFVMERRSLRRSLYLALVSFCKPLPGKQLTRRTMIRYLQLTPMSHPAENAILAGLHILIVDDDPDVLELLAFVLEGTGAIVTSTTSPTDAIEVCRQSKPDVLLSELNMPSKKGYTLLRKIRALPSELDKPVLAIALMGYGYRFSSRDLQAEGFQLYVTKLVNLDKLVPMIAEHVQYV